MLLIWGYAETILGEENKNKKSAESTAGRRLLDWLLSESDLKVTSEDLKTGEQGKPYFPNNPNVDFNITHSNRFVACILSVNEGKVGIDAEPTECAYPPEKQKALASRYFTDSERADLEDGKKSFTDLWTRREAWLKMTGDGFAKGIGNNISDDVCFTTLTIDRFTLTVCTEGATKITTGEYNK